MQIFQRNILNKYIEGLDSSLIDKQYKLYSDYFLNPAIQKNIAKNLPKQIKAVCNALTDQIAATDKEIDKMVYQLYGLTEDEIKVVERE